MHLGSRKDGTNTLPLLPVVTWPSLKWEGFFQEIEMPRLTVWQDLRIQRKAESTHKLLSYAILASGLVFMALVILTALDAA